MKSQLAIDVGATGIKGALVNLEDGTLISERIKYATPKPAFPADVAQVMNQIITDLEWKDGAIGIGFPAIVKNNLCLTASNIEDSWINTDIAKVVKEQTGFDSHSINDADAAGIAEMTYGKGKGQNGTVIMLTLGTGIGSGVFKDGVLLPNFELGRMIYREGVAEHYASNSARKSKDMNWETYGRELNELLLYVNSIFSPDQIIIGGGISKKYEKYSKYFNPTLKVTKIMLESLVQPCMQLKNQKRVIKLQHCLKP